MKRREWIEQLAARFEGSFPESLDGPRTIGREAEFPVVRPDGTAAEVAELWAPLKARDPSLKEKREGDLITALENDRVSYSSEVGRGTIEVIIGPFSDLVALQQAHEDAVGPLREAITETGALLLGYGIQPLTPATPAFMTPKQRYGVLLRTIGESWLWFTLTASDQVHMDLARSELVPVTNLCNLLAGVTVAFCANSPVYAGRFSGAMSAREATMGRIHAGSDRHGMPRAPDADVRDLVHRYVVQEHLMLRRDGVNQASSGPFLSFLEREGPTDPDRAWEDFLLHEHYIWNSARPRTAHATLELRAACQQPLGEHMAATALGAALVEAAPALSAFVQESLGDDPWPALRRFHGAAIREGLSAEEPFPGFLAGVLDRCEAALSARRLGEERFLAPLRSRLATRMNPAQRALQAFEAGGIAALVDHASAG